MLTPLIIEAAQASHKTFWPTGPFVSVILAQFGLESAWGKDASGLNNYFGIKANAEQIAQGHFTTRWTHEQLTSGKWVLIQQKFANYPSLEAGFDAHATLLVSPHYIDCQRAQTPEDYCRALQKDGYATDHNYADELIKIIDSMNLKQYDQRF